MAYSKHLRATQEHMRIITLALARLIKLCGTEECSWIENFPYPVSYSAIHSPGSTPRHNLLAPAGTWWPVLQLPWTRNPLFTQQPHPGLAHWVMLRGLCIVCIQERWRGGKGLGFLRGAGDTSCRPRMSGDLEFRILMCIYPESPILSFKASFLLYQGLDFGIRGP